MLEAIWTGEDGHSVEVWIGPRRVETAVWRAGLESVVCYLMPEPVKGALPGAIKITSA